MSGFTAPTAAAMKQWQAAVALGSLLLVVLITLMASERRFLDFGLRCSCEAETVSQQAQCVCVSCVLRCFRSVLRRVLVCSMQLSAVFSLHTPYLVRSCTVCA